MALVELQVFQSGIEAEIVRSRLAADGIAAVLFDAGLSSLGIGAMTPVRLMVDETDEPAARRALATPPEGEG
ncbi:MAG: DUF2007 domain-containing protein [Allosphingosinicella sp.]|uniref:putative signal transducing protein n=1 Tax=Allosphingosinicella sp. TaxID=2823234 RepID=UPI003950A695